MKLSPRVLAILVAVPAAVTLGCGAPPAEPPPPAPEEPVAEKEGGAVALFDGQSFEGWEGNEELFRVEEGAVVAGSLTDAIPHNEFLCTAAEFGDFKLRLQARSSREDANGGIQVRSRRAPDSTEVIGYQADIGLLGGETPRNIWGALYDESRRRELLAVGDQEGLAGAFRPGEWNDYVIKARGPRIGIWINGFQTVDYTEADEGIEALGLICLQVHSGPPAEIHYRQLEIETLDATPPE